MNMLNLRYLITILILSVSTASAENIVSGDAEVSVEMFDEALSLMKPDARRKYLRDLQAAAVLVDDLYKREKNVAEALKRGLDKQQWFQQQMARARKQLLLQALVNDVESSIEVPDVEALARQDYQLNQDKYRINEQVHARHILISTKDDENQARDKAEKILQRLQGGESFEDIARAESDDKKSAARGGDLGWFDRGRMVRPFEDGAFALTEPGQLSPLVKTKYGFHIIQLIEKKQGRRMSYDEVSVKLKYQLAKKYHDQELNRKLQEFESPEKADADIPVLKKAYAAAVAKYRNAPPTPPGSQ